MGKIIVVFDLDDTLYKEIDYLKSAYREIAEYISYRANKPKELIYEELLMYYNLNVNAFKKIIETHKLKDVNVYDLIEIYRNHIPDIKLSKQVLIFLENLKNEIFKVGLITDGRSLQQRNKIKALGLSNYFDEVIISEEFGSEKPCIENYKYFEKIYGKELKYIYIGDNTSKDFIAPKKLGWVTMCIIDNGKNIHKQSFSLRKDVDPDFKVNSLIDVKPVILKMNS